MPPLQHSNLLRELQEENAFFDSLVDMIPAKLYVAGNSGKFLTQTFFFV
jgi:60S ribosome biogenesis protein Rrp14